MSINKRLDELFHTQHPEFTKESTYCMDGVIDEEAYAKAPIKILFLMKEPNNPETEGWDYREWWKDEVKHTFSKRIAEWSHGILNKDNNGLFPCYESILEDKSQLEVLQSIAFINVKKKGGTGSSDEEEIVETIRRDRAYILTQIEAISPDLIVCGLSWPTVRNTLWPDVVWESNGYCIPIGHWKNITLIDFYHPSSRSAPPAMYTLLEKTLTLLRASD